MAYMDFGSWGMGVIANEFCALDCLCPQSFEMEIAMTPNLNDLEAKARAATQGEWFENREWVQVCLPPNADIAFVSDVNINSKANRKFIADANPAVILSLIARIRELEGALKPFATSAKTALSSVPDNHELRIVYGQYAASGVGTITAGDLRRAAPEPSAKDKAFDIMLEALKPLADACEKDFLGPVMLSSEDDEAVGGGADGDMALQVGHIRKALSAIAAAQAVKGGE